MAAAPSTTHADPTIPQPTTGTLVARKDGAITLAIPGTDYRIDLVVDGPLASAKTGGKLTGIIHARALRVDRVTAGGRFVEPVMGRPRRVQGVITGGDLKANALFVAAGGVNLVCTLTDARQHAGDFELGQMFSFDVERGARFEPM